MTIPGIYSSSVEALPSMPFLDQDYKAQPYRWYERWAVAPPFWALVEGKRVVVAARFKDVEYIYRNHDTFSSVKPPEPGMEKFDFFNGMRDLVHVDPPDHSRLRSVIRPAFLPSAVARLEPALQRLIDELLDPIESGDGSFEVMSQFARPLSTQTMLGLVLKMQMSDFCVFENLSAAMSLLSEVPPGGKAPAAYLHAWDAARCYCQQLIEDRRAEPSDDLIGSVVSAQRSGVISEDELLVLLIGLFIGGLSTVATQLGNAFYQIVSRPDQYRELVRDPSQAANAFEEVMRFDSAGLFNYKFAKHDCAFEGLEIPAGTTIYILQQAAGFDPAIYEDPFRFDIRRSIKRHLSFGFGIHFCIGAPVARLVGRVALTTAARRLPNLRLAGNEPIRYGGWLQERAPLAVPMVIR